MNRSKLQKGSALSVILILAMGVGSVVTSFLGRTLVEQSRVSQRASQMRAYRQAMGQLELAKAIINGSGFAGTNNIAVATARASNPPVIPGTGVFVEDAGPARWYRLVSTGEYNRETAATTAFVRDGTPYVSYNYYVEEHPLGISGRPRGKLHTNEEMNFYFPDGYYDGYVTAVDGFDYQAGATIANTTLAGGSNSAEVAKDLLDTIDFAALAAQAAVVTPVDLEADVTLLDANVRIDLYTKPSIVQVPVTKFKKVQTGVVWSPVTVTNYVKQYQWVNVQKSKKVWVPVNPVNEGGVDVGGGGNVTGYWQTQYYWQLEWKLVNVPSGTTTVWKWVATYANVPYTVMVNQTVAGTFVSTNTYAAADSIFFISDNVRALAGNLNGKCSIITTHDVLVTGSLRYRDSSGQYAYLNGLSNVLAYTPNPAFVRNHALGVIAKGDIRYARTSPAIMEVNGSLISTNGMVGMEGIVLDNAGNPSLSGSQSLKTSLRRFGTIMAAKRPVSSLLNNMNQVIHGFQEGQSEYDEGLITYLPPGAPQEDVAMWHPNMRASGANFTFGGTGVYDVNSVTPIAASLTPITTVRNQVQNVKFDWGCTGVCN